MNSAPRRTEPALDAASILVLDDDVELSEILRIRLERDGFSVGVANTVAQFEDACRGTLPRAVVVDLNLGQQDGLLVAERLVTLGFTGPVFLISGSDDRVLTAARRHAEALGLELPAVFHKPFSLAALSSSIRDAVQGSRDDVVSATLQALRNGAIRPFFQPQVDLRSGRLVGAEALARWVRPDGSVQASGRFLPVIASENLWAELTDAMLRGTATAIVEWRAAGRVPCHVSVNLEADTAIDPAFGPHAADLLDGMGVPNDLIRFEITEQTAMGVPNDLIRFEITEQTAMGDTAKALRALTWLRIKGFDLAIDDFGTGFSSLAALHAMPFTELKIDQSFVRRMTTDESARVIVKATVDLAHNLGLVCVAEGVETEQTIDMLRAFGCDRGQGFIFGGAADSAKFAERLALQAQPPTGHP